MNAINKTISSFIVICLIFGLIYGFFCTISGLNSEGEKNLYKYLEENRGQSLNINSMGKNFHIVLIPNSSINSMNPHFPVIRISPEEKHNGWIHIIETDAKEKKWQRFLDASRDQKIAPFYSYNQDFYDAPLWQYTLFRKPLSFWKGHAYSVEIDHENRKIKCLGGIEWGFKLSFFKIRPDCLTPRPLVEEDWIRDREFFKKASYQFYDDSKKTQFEYSFKEHL